MMREICHFIVLDWDVGWCSLLNDLEDSNISPKHRMSALGACHFKRKRHRWLRHQRLCQAFGLKSKTALPNLKPKDSIPTGDELAIIERSNLLTKTP